MSNDDDRKMLSERLREAREYLGFSQEEGRRLPGRPPVCAFTHGDGPTQGGRLGAEEASRTL